MAAVSCSCMRNPARAARACVYILLLSVWYSVVVEPEVINLPFNDEELDAVRRFYGREPVSVGPVACRGFFRSKESDGVYYESSMLIIWFQQGFLTPMDNWTLERIKAIDWDTLSNKVTADEYFADF